MITTKLLILIMLIFCAIGCVTNQIEVIRQSKQDVDTTSIQLNLDRSLYGFGVGDVVEFTDEYLINKHPELNLTMLQNFKTRKHIRYINVLSKTAILCDNTVAPISQLISAYPDSIHSFRFCSPAVYK